MLYSFILVVVLFAVIFQDSFATFGWETEYPITSSTMSCFQQTNNASYATFIGLDKYSAPDPNICNSFQVSKAAGIQRLDAELIPCPTCGESAKTQINLLIDNLNKNCPGYWSGNLWLNLNTHQFWPTPWTPVGYIENQKWFEGLVDACISSPSISCGITSNSQQWNYIFGNAGYTYAPAAKLPLKLVALDGNPSFNAKFNNFGGYTSAAFKLYTSGQLCGIYTVYSDYTESI